jgi:hypothetical protein
MHGIVSFMKSFSNFCLNYLTITNQGGAVPALFSLR